MVEEVHVVIIPGLGNEIQKHIWASDRWKKFGIIPHVFDAKWKTEENSDTLTMTLFRGRIIKFLRG